MTEEEQKATLAEEARRDFDNGDVGAMPALEFCGKAIEPGGLWAGLSGEEQDRHAATVKEFFAFFSSEYLPNLVNTAKARGIKEEAAAMLRGLMDEGISPDFVHEMLSGVHSMQTEPKAAALHGIDFSNALMAVGKKSGDTGKQPLWLVGKALDENGAASVLCATSVGDYGRRLALVVTMAMRFAGVGVSALVKEFEADTAAALAAASTKTKH